MIVAAVAAVAFAAEMMRGGLSQAYRKTSQSSASSSIEEEGSTDDDNSPREEESRVGANFKKWIEFCLCKMFLAFLVCVKRTRLLMGHSYYSVKNRIHSLCKMSAD